LASHAERGHGGGVAAVSDDKRNGRQHVSMRQVGVQLGIGRSSMLICDEPTKSAAGVTITIITA
jgi:hypothetical protein